MTRTQLDPTARMHLALELLTTWINRSSGNDDDVATYISTRLTEHITDRDAPEMGDFVSGLLFLSELLVLQLANEIAPNDPDHLVAKAVEILQFMAPQLPENPLDV